MQKRKIFIIVGTRPNFMKAAPLLKEFKKSSCFNAVLVHTGQHYEVDMSKSFFDDLGLPEPHINLGIGSGTHAAQVGKLMIEFEKVCFKEKPDLVVVVGDVNSTIACALVASKLCISVAHIEAGLRSFDRTMPEEINRILTDQISDYLFTTCEDANKNLKREGISGDKIFFVGNVMIDTLMHFVKKAEESNLLEKLSLKNDGKVAKYAVLTLHRPSNVDDPDTFKNTFSGLSVLSTRIPIIFPAHPRTMKNFKNFFSDNMVTFMNPESFNNFDEIRQKIYVTSPLGYLDFLCLMSNSKLVLTDSGGIQEETTILGIPCLTIRSNTERPITVREGTNTLVGNDPDKILNTAIQVLEKGITRKRIPKYWDGKAAERIVKILTSGF